MNYKKMLISTLWCLAILNFLDMTFTGIGLHFGYFEEKNILMRNLWDAHPFYFYIVKSSLSVFLVILARSSIRKLKPSIITVSVAGVAMLLYSGVMVLHGIAYHYILFQ